jgi:radical SAM protein with 4Fe4S-binding SPASM domain
LPEVSFNFTHDLNAILCCHDYQGEHVYGNLRDSSIAEIWNGQSFRRMRSQLRAGKPTFDICKDCFGFKL